MIRADLHVHTVYSYDGYLSLNDLGKTAKRRGIDVVAITDHNTMAGAEEAFRAAKAGLLPVRIIMGEEIKTSQGEIIGLFLHEEIPSGMSMADSIRAIKEQGGLVSLNHPFGYSQRSEKIDMTTLEPLWDLIDIVEIFNGRNMKPEMNARAFDLAKCRNKPMVVGTDAHSAWELGRSYSYLPKWETPQEFLAGCKETQQWVTRACPLWYRILFKGRKMIGQRPLPIYDNTGSGEGKG